MKTIAQILKTLPEPEADISRYLSGELIYGDDFSQDEIEDWFRDEENGYAGLDHEDAKAPVYLYHALNLLHGFNYLPDGRFERVLGIGSAYGEEFKPIIDRIDSLTILDASEKFIRNEISGGPVTYRKPRPDGKLLFSDDCFDLITCFGVLHHIPNVSFVLSEMSRCLKPGGYALIREPIVSMGDWTRSRRGLTKRERGIPVKCFDKVVLDNGYEVMRRGFCVFPPVGKLTSICGIRGYNSRFITSIDKILSFMTGWNNKYHRATFLDKLGPNSIFYVLRKKVLHLHP
jgi:SAM-dependent methyltransferase